MAGRFKIKGHLAEIVNHTFQTLLVTYLILLLIEQVWTSSVSVYFNLNYLLIAVIVAGIIDVFSEHKPFKEKKANWKDYSLVILLGIAGFFIIKIKTDGLGWLSWVISVIAGILIVLLSLIVLEEDETIEKQKSSKPWSWKVIMPVISGLLLLISIVIPLFSSISLLGSLRIVFGSVYVLFLPGFIISYLFFPKTSDKEEKGSIDWIERTALSFALSIAIVPLLVFYFNLVGIKISLINSSLIILGIIIVSSGILYWKNRK